MKKLFWYRFQLLNGIVQNIMAFNKTQAIERALEYGQLKSITNVGEVS